MRYNRHLFSITSSGQSVASFLTMALYHTHRPQTFDSIIGQHHIIRTIQNQVIGGNPAHAYLFSGPRGIGKTTTARVLAKAVNCKQKKDSEANPCNDCASCNEINAGMSIDVIEIDAASHTGVDNVRENIIDNAKFKPATSKYKVFIIDEVHMLSLSAFNALLKILEEPPGHVLFILATTELHKLPQTIQSRCQRFAFSRVSEATIIDTLRSIAKAENVAVDDSVLKRVAGKSEGCVRDAVSLLEQLIAAAGGAVTDESVSMLLPPSTSEEVTVLLQSLFQKNAAECLSLIQRLSTDGIDMAIFCDEAITMLRTLLIYAYQKNILLEHDPRTIGWIESVQGSVSPKEIVRLADMLSFRRGQVCTAPLAQLPLELLVIEWCNSGEACVEKKNQGETLADRAPVEVAEPHPTVATTTAPPPTMPEKKNSENSISSFSEADVRKSFEAAILAIEKESPSLVYILKSCRVERVNNKSITIAVLSEFHRERLADKRCKKQLQESFSDSLGTPGIELEFVVEKSASEAERINEITHLAAAFGGEIV